MDTRIRFIEKPDQACYEAAQRCWDSIAKPLGSFGALEEMICRIAAIQGDARVSLDRSMVVVMCADNGVVAEGVTQSPQSVTAACAVDIAEGKSNINAIAREYGAGVVAVDIGIAWAEVDDSAEAVKDAGNAVAAAEADGGRNAGNAAAEGGAGEWKSAGNAMAEGGAGARKSVWNTAVEDDTGEWESAGNAMADTGTVAVKCSGNAAMAVSAEAAGKQEPGVLLNRRLMNGTWNIAMGPAMSYQTAEAAISTGMDIVRDLRNKGTDIIFTGEMGIGNTTIASALASFWLELPADKVTGRGAGLSGEGLMRKQAIVERAIAVNRPQRNDPVDVLARIGGLDVAGLTGVFLGGAYYRVPVVIDGVVSAAAAYTAWRIAPECAGYMLAGHLPAEPAGRIYLEAMGLRPVIDAGLRLGEGTGGIMLLALLKGACALYNNSHTFDELGIEQYRRLS